MSLTHFKSCLPACRQTRSADRLRKLFADFWRKKNHKEVLPISLVPKDDPTTLFTSSGMQPLIPYLMGEPHPLGKRLYNIQPCFRSQDIEYVGDNRHTTFFEMVGNWSLGDYFKEEQLEWCLEFFTGVLGLPKKKLFVTVFAGTKEVPRDEESAAIWKKLGISKERIFYYGAEKNWWSRSGTPDKMPPGEIGGPDSEMFYDFGTSHNPSFGKVCHPNCDCGRFLEIGNSVFIQYKKKENGQLEELPQKNVDFGGGLERILAALNNDPHVFKSDVFLPVVEVIKRFLDNDSKKEELDSFIQVIADHLKGALFMIKEGIQPNNKLQGYVLRRLIRRSVVKMMQLNIVPLKSTPAICQKIVEIYSGTYLEINNSHTIISTITKEIDDFLRTIDKATKLLQTQLITGKLLFYLHQSYGLPFEIAQELLHQWGKPIGEKEKKQFDEEQRKHQELSRTTSVGMFKGGLANQSEQTIKYHTATHLLHQALKDMFGNEVRQEGSNITAERLRFDFQLSKKPTDDEIKKIEDTINQKIKGNLPVYFKVMPKDEAFKIGAASFFKEKYGDQVKVYFIGNYSKEFCGGPHVKNTSEIGSFKIIKVKKIGSNLMRIYAK